MKCLVVVTTLITSFVFFGCGEDTPDPHESSPYWSTIQLR